MSFGAMEKSDYLMRRSSTPRIRMDRVASTPQRLLRAWHEERISSPQ